jgi:hypothetical protein
MDETFRYHTRPGNLPLSLLALAGLILLAAQLWAIMPGYVMLVFLPALLACIAQLILSPIYGLSLSDTAWRIEAGEDTRELRPDQIAYLRVHDAAISGHTEIVLADGSVIEMPREALPDPLVLIREVTSRGIPVRQV